MSLQMKWASLVLVWLLNPGCAEEAPRFVESTDEETRQRDLGHDDAGDADTGDVDSD